jgi:hypothetical protein
LHAALDAGAKTKPGATDNKETTMTVNTERRDFIRSVGAVAASTTVLAGTPALAQANQQTGAKAMPFQA